MITLRHFDQQNLALHYKWSKDQELNYYSEFSTNVDSFQAFLRHTKLILAGGNQSADLFEIYCTESNKLIGIVELSAIDMVNRRCFVRCTIGHPNFDRKQYEIVALRKALDYCFNELQMHKVCASAFEFNTTWIEGIQKLGFKKEGELRQHILQRETYCDKLVFGLLAEEYKQVNKGSRLRAVN